MRTLSSVLREEGIGRVDLLKLDVEKSELDVLNGIEEADWPKIFQVVAEVHDIDDRLEKVRGLLCSHDFSRISIKQEPILEALNIYNIYALR